MAFKVGQLVQCIKKGEWRSSPDCVNSPRPKYGDICTVEECGSWGPGLEWLGLKEYQSDEAFLAIHFRPLQETGMNILKAILANPHKQLETVE